MACRRFDTMPLSDPMTTYCHLDPQEKLMWKLFQNTNVFNQWNKFVNFVCKMATILSRFQYIKWEGATYLLPTDTLQWRHNERDGVSNHQPHDCLLNRLYRRRSKKTSASLAFGRGIHRWPVNSPHKWPVTRKMFPFDDVTLNACSFDHLGRKLSRYDTHHTWP